MSETKDNVAESSVVENVKKTAKILEEKYKKLNDRLDQIIKKLAGI